MRSMAFTALLLAVAMLAGGCGVSRDAHPDSLGGKVTVNGKPVRSAALTVTGPDGKTAGGMTNEAGVYVIPNPPKGKLEFRFSSPGGKAAFPAKYTKPNNGVAFEYEGGQQTYDINLKS